MTTPTPENTSPSSPEHSPSTTPDEPTTAPGSALVAADASMPSGALAERLRYAEALASAGDLIPRGLRDGNKPNVGKVLLAVETGGMLGIHPIAALNGVNIIEGKATLSPGLMSAVVRRAGHKLRVRTTGSVAAGDIRVTVTLIRADDPEAPFESTWDVHRAVRAGLCDYAKGADNVWRVTARSDRGKALPWEAYTEAMLKARAIGEVCREGAEDALMGVHYTPEELGATVDADGVMVDLGMVEARVEEVGPDVEAFECLRRAVAAPDVPGLMRVWNATERVVAQHTWAREYRDLVDYAKRTTVTLGAPYVTPDTTLSLFDAFATIKRHLEGGGGPSNQDPPRGPQAPQDGADEPVDAQVEPEPATTPQTPAEDVQDAEVIDEAPADDPWSDGGSQAGQGMPEEAPLHDAAVAAATAGLGGQVVSEDATTARDRVAADHAAQVAANAAGRETAHDDLGGQSSEGVGRDAARAARAELERRNAERAREEAARTPRRNGAKA